MSAIQVPLDQAITTRLGALQKIARQIQREHPTLVRQLRREFAAQTRDKAARRDGDALDLASLLEQAQSILERRPDLREEMRAAYDRLNPATVRASSDDGASMLDLFVAIVVLVIIAVGAFALGYAVGSGKDTNGDDEDARDRDDDDESNDTGQDAGDGEGP